MQINHYIEILRIKQWIKNVLIFFPAFFSLSIQHENIFFKLLWIAIGFCLLASASYIFNDISDIKGDSLHPIKKKKSIASDKISKKKALLIYFFLMVIGVLIIVWVYPMGISFCLAYLFLNYIYSKKLKHLPIVDILLLTLGYIIRISLGGYAINVVVSKWLLILVSLMSIYILIAKRKDDVLMYQNSQQVIRKHIHFYKNLNFPVLLYSLSFIIIIIYTLYVFSNRTNLIFETNYLWTTIPFAIIGLFSFTHQIISINKHIEPISIVLKSKLIMSSLIAWFTLFGWLIYG